MTLCMTTQADHTKGYIDEFKALGGGVVAHRYHILTTDIVCYAVYEQTEHMGPLGHYSSYQRTEEHGLLGDLTTKGLPPSINQLPAWSWERIDAAECWHASLERLAEAYIRAAFPSDFPHQEIYRLFFAGDPLKRAKRVDHEDIPAGYAVLLYDGWLYPVSCTGYAREPYAVFYRTNPQRDDPVRYHDSESSMKRTLAFLQERVAAERGL